MCERLLRSFKYELPGSGANRFTVDPGLIENPEKRLAELLEQGQRALAEELAAMVMAGLDAGAEGEQRDEDGDQQGDVRAADEVERLVDEVARC